MTDTTETTSHEPILFYFDFSSPYAYIAAHKIDQIAALYGREVDWRPTLLGAIFQQTGAKPLTETGLKAEYSKHDFLRTTRSFGLPFTMPDSFPFASIAAARSCMVAEGPGPGPLAQGGAGDLRQGIRRRGRCPGPKR